MSGITIMQDASEIIPFDNPGLPLYVSVGPLSGFPNRRMLCHWHEEIEFISVVSGSMCYRVGKKNFLLSPGDTLFVNSRQLHYGFGNSDKDCIYRCILCHPDLLGRNNRVLYRQFLAPILDNRSIQYLYFKAGTPDAETVFGITERILTEKQDAAPGYELACISQLYTLWRFLYPFSADTNFDTRDYTDESLQKEMVSYIQNHFSEHITLADIAAAGHICQNKCCVIFRRYLQQSPVDFLNAYRLEVSCSLLTRTDKSISDIALSCGFNHLSYYSKLFQRKYGCTPTQWRKNTTQS